ncbi:hypothetical protein SAMN04489761_2663 [Tenacibaculum sp. MAR_2009_124]|uniref:TIGR04282 family arsenosugar biosynthesis glycosyltransferase n=1 Tax=Tenacibaculum sp. MAR_2009_124 TaxID=1250059 RepID=UPI00089B750A|nr:DUF2064 domain-containing protein [Tenacibaculum sp. MAR_2009_124]SEC31826.1 hypothetical protein SAMN04489761_2663 [Tenacibaculum sp. MAR_2009_124]
MLENTDKTAILIFANSSKKEILRKSFLKDEKLVDYLNSKTVKIAKKACSNVIVYDENLQVGANFSEKFANAITDVFSKGFNHIVTIGNDSPELKATDITNAIINLQKGKNVIGPSKDGGVYLIGLHKKQFNREEFTSLSWQTNFLGNDLEDLLKSKGAKIEKLQRLKDIDCYDDLIYFSTCFSVSKNLKSFITIIIGILKESIRSRFIFTYKYHYSAQFYNKGSPLSPS